MNHSAQKKNIRHSSLREKYSIQNKKNIRYTINNIAKKSKITYIYV